MKRCMLLCGIVLLSWLPTPGAAAQTGAGDKELSFSISLADGLNPDSEGELVANTRFGVYVTDHFELGGGLSARGELDAIEERATFETFGLYRFSPGSPTSLYLRAGYLGFVQEPGDGFADLTVGYRVELCEGAAVFTEAGYGTAISGDLDGELLRSATGLMLTF